MSLFATLLKQYIFSIFLIVNSIVKTQPHPDWQDLLLPNARVRDYLGPWDFMTFNTSLYFQQWVYPQGRMTATHYVRMSGSHHRMGPLSASLAFCQGNPLWPLVRGIYWSPVDFLHKRPVRWNFDVFFSFSISKQSDKWSSCHWHGELMDQNTSYLWMIYQNGRKYCIRQEELANQLQPAGLETNKWEILKRDWSITYIWYTWHNVCPLDIP